MQGADVRLAATSNRPISHPSADRRSGAADPAHDGHHCARSFSPLVRRRAHVEAHAVAIIFGLLLATVLPLRLVPALYRIFFRVKFE